MLTLQSCERLNIQPGKLSEGRRTDVTWLQGKREGVLNKVIPVKTWKLKEISEIFHSIENEEGKMSEPNLNFRIYNLSR